MQTALDGQGRVQAGLGLGMGMGMGMWSALAEEAERAIIVGMYRSFILTMVGGGVAWFLWRFKLLMGGF